MSPVRTIGWDIQFFFSHRTEANQPALSEGELSAPERAGDSSIQTVPDRRLGDPWHVVSVPPAQGVRLQYPRPMQLMAVSGQLLAYVLTLVAVVATVLVAWWAKRRR